MQPFAYLGQDPEVLSIDGGFVNERPKVKVIPEPKGISPVRLFLQQQRELVGMAANDRLGYNSVARTIMLDTDSHFYGWVRSYHGKKLNTDLSAVITTPDDPVLRLVLIFTLQEIAHKKPRSAGHLGASIRHTWVYASKILQGISDLYTVMFSRKGYSLVVDRPSTSTDHYGLTRKDLEFWRYHVNSGNYQRYRAAQLDSSIIEVFRDELKTLLLSSGSEDKLITDPEEDD